MAFPKIIVAAFAALTLHLSPAHADECVSIDTFHSKMSSQGLTLYGSRAAATERMEKLLNENRAKGGKPAIAASVFLVGYVKDKDGEIIAVVSVFDKNNCLIEDTVTMLSLRMWVEFIVSVGVDPDEFAVIGGA